MLNRIEPHPEPVHKTNPLGCGSQLIYYPGITGPASVVGETEQELLRIFSSFPGSNQAYNIPALKQDFVVTARTSIQIAHIPLVGI